MTRTVAFSAFLVVATLILGLSAQERANERAHQPILLVDVGEVAAEDSELQKVLAALQVEIEAFELEAKRASSSIDKLSRELQDLDRRSEAYQALEKRIRNAKAELQETIAVNKASILSQEAMGYDQAYARIRETVEDYAKESGSRLVLRTSHPREGQDHETVLHNLNATVVFQDGLDITDIIIERLKNNEVP